MLLDIVVGVDVVRAENVYCLLMSYLGSLLSLSSLRSCCSRGALYKKIDDRDEYCGVQRQNIFAF